VYVFDTDVLSLLLKGRLPAQARRLLAAVSDEKAMTTAVTVGELHYGAQRSPATARWLSAIERALSRLGCLPFDADAARCYGDLRARLEQAGRRLDDPDLRLAAICVSTGSVLVSGNEAHFARVPGLRYENWLTE